MRTPKTGDLISITLADWKTPLSGVFIAASREWVLIHYNPVDYVIDGYLLIRRKYIEEIIGGDSFKQKVIALKKLQFTAKEKFPLSGLNEILTYLTKKFSIFTLYAEHQDACYLGALKSLTHQKLVISYVCTKGTLDGDMSFKPSEIRTIAFDNDYINSLKLVLRKLN